MSEKQEEKKKLTKTEISLIAVIALSIILLIFFGIRLSRKMDPEVLNGDKAVCNRINTILEDNSGKYVDKTVGDVLDFLVSKGFIVENLSPTLAGNYYIYNSSTNKFVLVDDMSEDAKVVFGKLSKNDLDNWAIVDTQAEFDNTSNYSHYLTSGFDGDKELYIKTNIDASNCSSVKSIIVNVDLKNKLIVCFNPDVCDFENYSSTTIEKHLAN